MNSGQTRRKSDTHAYRTPEARENSLISLAMDLAEERMKNGTATAAEVVHFLKLGSAKSRAETEKLELEKELVKAKTENLRAQQELSSMFAEAMNAMKEYRGEASEEDEDDYAPY